jgi:hypothetical protein
VRALRSLTFGGISLTTRRISSKAILERQHSADARGVPASPSSRHDPALGQAVSDAAQGEARSLEIPHQDERGLLLVVRDKMATVRRNPYGVGEYALRCDRL